MKYITLGDWYRKSKNEEYEVPLALYHTLDKMINERGLSFSEAYEELLKQGKIEIDGKTIKFYLNKKEKFKAN